MRGVGVGDMAWLVVVRIAGFGEEGDRRIDEKACKCSWFK